MNIESKAKALSLIESIVADHSDVKNQETFLKMFGISGEGDSMQIRAAIGKDIVFPDREAAYHSC